MSDADNVLTQATDEIIALYRNIERSALDLPLISFMPALIFLWSIIKFEFFFIVGFFLIVPTNLIILIRNLFPGHWKYRPFFLHHLFYVWLWVWRGEAPTAPFIFIRPVLNIFMKGHFERRLRRLRIEISLHDGLSDATRSALLTRLDRALERWQLPRLRAIFLTVLLPGIISFPSWYKALSEFLVSLGVQIPTNALSIYLSKIPLQALVPIGLAGLGYLLVVPVTGFLAKRGLFIGRESKSICFPGGQAGCGVYLKEKEILDNVGMHPREAPIDLWLIGVVLSMQLMYVLLFGAWTERGGHSNLDPELARRIESMLWVIHSVSMGLMIFFVGLVIVAAHRRRKTGRA